MADHADLYPLIAPEVLGCPLPTIDSAINRAAGEFCKGSLAWQESLGALTLAAGTSRVDLDLPLRSMLVAIMTARADGRLLAPVADARGEIAWGVARGEPYRYALLPGRRAIGIDPAPLVPIVLAIDATLAPAATATALPDILVDEYAEEIAEGAKAILMRAPGQAWSNPAGSQFYDHSFRVRIAQARIDREHGAAPSLTVTPRAFG